LGLNRRFEGKQAKSLKFYIIKTTALISTKFGTTIETIKWSSWVVPIGTQQVQNDSRHFEEKTLNRHISATIRSILMKFGMVMHIGPWQQINR